MAFSHANECTIDGEVNGREREMAQTESVRLKDKKPLKTKRINVETESFYLYGVVCHPNSHVVDGNYFLVYFMYE